jgi:type III pantothenate kinase
VRLLLDLGNTRLKAGLGSAAGQLTLLGHAQHRGRDMAVALAEALGGVELDAAAGALCANVAGEAAGQALARALGARSGAPLAFLRAQAEACGVHCAYPEPQRLGADRWAALLGARGLGDSAALVVDAGSALTIDAMAGGGRHLGGWILPGLAMMIEALEARTGDLEALRRASTRRPGEFPVDTGPAMEAGALLAAAGAVTRARQRLERLSGSPARLLLAGGDAPALLAELGAGEHVPDLVLLGLARAAAPGARAS